MLNNEIETEQRITNIMYDEYGMNVEEMTKILRAFEKLNILKKNMPEMIRKKGKRTFELKKGEYQEKMNWINDYMKLKGMKENVFTDLDSYEISSDDYDYYYELKTPTQYKEEEEARKAKKLGTKPAGDGREPGDE